MLLVKRCKFCRCSKCRWQLPDSCTHGAGAPCGICSGDPKQCERSYECKGYAKRAKEARHA